jgi:hypothetical protein
LNPQPSCLCHSASSNCATTYPQLQHRKNFNLHFAHVSDLIYQADLVAG